MGGTGYALSVLLRLLLAERCGYLCIVCVCMSLTVTLAWVYIYFSACVSLPMRLLSSPQFEAAPQCRRGAAK